MHVVAKQLLLIEEELNEFFLERRDHIRVALLAILSGEHMFAIGGPGTGKSMLHRHIIRAIVGARSFEKQLGNRTPLEDVIGPLDLLEFRTNGNYWYKRKGYASAVELLNLDEIGKASPILLNELLTLTNERGYTEVRGEDEPSFHKSPLSTALTAANEMLTDESEASAAFWDRLLFRVIVDSIKSKKNFATLLTAATPATINTIEWDDLHEAITVDVPAIPMSKDALNAMVMLRSDFARQHLDPSVRRWRWSVKAMQANAFLNGRSQIEPEDLAVLRFTLWETVEQVDKVAELCLSASNPFVKPLSDIRKGISEISAGVSEREAGDAGARWQYGHDAAKKLQQARDALDVMLIEAQGEPIPGFKAVSDQYEATLLRTYMVCLENSEEIAQVVVNKKLGSGDGGNV